ncbi:MULTISPECIES: acyl-CoA dehydrogenase family protein [Sphingomonas]|jgi:acyl-CoA dehydrogenase|uniref:acyl-CoA dehydrogenase family protein n=1 Tax=Sphingomonas TaxID=13687 RepID=UPI00082D5255|nr:MULTISPECIES: acyl-CoA dehydrogenase family protein [Sphingomonas]MBY0300821.1 acyl-CoA dehydrogenase family protein [Sphingomonas ginsenosidimutans]
MNFDYTDKTRDLIARVEAFMAAHVYPAERERHEFVIDQNNLWQEWPGLEPLKARAKAEGLWNLFLPHEYGHWSPGLTNLEYAPLAEIMGRVPWSSEVFNCSAPDTGNMEVLAKYGSPEQQQSWLKPLLAGEIRSAYVMTEPQVASSDATNLEMSITADGEDYVINGRKWWISNFMHPQCTVLLVMGKTDFDAPRHLQHSTIIVPKDTPGVTVVRHQRVFGSLNSPGGECELRFNDVRVPRENLILGEGRGFEIAQGRLGPGRIHHCMRSIGQAQRALEIMARRVENRVAFGRKLSDQSSIRQDVARSFCEVEMARLLTLKAADRMDRFGNKDARDLIAAIKVIAPQMAQTVADRAIQSHGGMGVSDDTPVAEFFTLNRFLRLADGPDEVHMSQLGKQKITEYNAMNAY